MTYLKFHLFFTIPPFLAIAFLSHKAVRSYFPQSLFSLGVHVILAIAYTSPWDNYLIAKGIWSYFPERVTGRIGYIPIEEYLFFILQTLISGLLTIRLLKPPKAQIRSEDSPLKLTNRWNLGGALFFLLLFFAGLISLTTPSTLYLGLILSWASPICALQWFVGGDVLRSQLKSFLGAVSVSTIYLWSIDLYALKEKIWIISDNFTTGLAIWGLPLEEALFFLMTNLMVIQGTILFLNPEMIDRVRKNKWISLKKKSL